MAKRRMTKNLLRILTENKNDRKPILHLQRLQGNDTELDDLQYFTWLETLMIYQNSAKKPLKIPVLPKQIKKLGILGNQISDISNLADLTGLEELQLPDNQIIDVSSLANLQQLKILILRNNQISDISPLANLTELEHLDLSSNQIKDISPLVNLQKLESLYLSNNQLFNISVLKNLTELNFLEIE